MKQLNLSLLVLFLWAFVVSLSIAPVSLADSCTPAWNGTVLIDCDSLDNWSVEADATGPSSGSTELQAGLVSGQSVQLNWNLGNGDWVQGKYTFPEPQDLSSADIFGITLQGGGPSETSNRISIMFADVNDVFYGLDLEGNNAGINNIDRPLFNLPFAKEMFYHFFHFGETEVIDWSQINRFFIVVKRPSTSAGGGSGQLRIDHVQYGTASAWERQTAFDTVTVTPELTAAAAKAVAYLLSQQDADTGLFVSWKEEPSQKSHLYDLALSLIVLCREGNWADELPQNDRAAAADHLVAFLLAHQKEDGHWARTWNPATGEELNDDGWVGDQAWWITALSIYAKKANHAAARAAALRGADWLAAQIDSFGKVTASTEGNVDAWWALTATCRMADAAKIQAYLLDDRYAWNNSMQYWRRGYNDPVIAMDAQTWLSAFARHPAVQEESRAKAALSFAGRTLRTSSDDGTLCGFDGMGPVSVWNEGTAQYIAAGGQGAQAYLTMLLSQQHTDGSMPGSPDNWASDAFGWLSNWSGLAPTAWLYFASTGQPFDDLPPSCGKAGVLPAVQMLLLNR